MQIVAKPHSFSAPQQFAILQGSTLKEIVDRHVPTDAIVQLNGDIIPKEQWQYITPVEGDNIVVTVSLHGGGSSKNMLRTILSIVVVAGAFAFGQWGVAAHGWSAFQSAAAAGFVAAAGTALVNALIPIRTPSIDTSRQSPSFAIGGARNDARQFGAVPLILGRHRMSPPLAAAPYTELLGSDEYLRMGVCWGYSPVRVSDIRIGNTSLSTNGLANNGRFKFVRINTTDNNLLEWVPSTVTQEAVNVELKQKSELVTRTTEEDIDEFSFDIVFPQGYGVVNDDGSIRDFEYFRDEFGDLIIAEFTYRYRKTGTTTFSPFNYVHINKKTKDVVRYGVTVEVPERGQYDVEISRVYSKNPDARVLDRIVWSYLRSIRNDRPVNFRKPLTMTSLRIKATEQLSGVIDNLNGIVESLVPTWNGSAWTGSNATSNPAALFRWVLLGPGSDRPRTVSQIDNAKLGEWYEFCETNGYEFNQIRDFQDSIWDTLADIAAAGRAAPTLIDGKWSVIIDEPGKPVVQHFTPRNSWDFQSSKSIPIQPHAFRIRFWNEDRDWQVDERIVADDGYRAGEAAPTQFERIEFPGITDPDLIWKFGRYFIAQARLRPEEYSFGVDFEHLACQRGDVVLMNHDVTLWGSGAGRVTEVKTDSSDDIVGVVVDEEFIVEPGKTYNMRFRLEDGSSFITNVTPAGGDGVRTEFDFAATSQNIQIGDLVMFGEVNSEAQRLVVKRIERGADFTARLVCVDEAPALYEADTGDIPPFDSNTTDPVDITQTQPDAPQIINVESGTNALIPLGNGAFMARILVGLEPTTTIPAARNYQVRFRSGGNDWQMETTSPSELTVPLAPVQTGDVYEIQARAISVFNVLGMWGASVFEEVVGELEPPQDVTGFIATQTKYGVKLKWNPVSDVDLRDYEIRVGADWDTAAVLANIDASEWLWAIQQAGTYTLWIAARDFAGIYSVNPAQYAIEVIGPSAIDLEYHFDGPDVVLEWTQSTSLFAVEDYLVQIFDANDEATRTYTASMTTSFRVRVDWGGTRKIGVTPVDIAGNMGPTRFVSVLVIAPGVVRNLTVQVIDNNVLLNWVRPAEHSLPISHYEVFKGATFATAVEIGEVGGTFSPIFETEAGLFTYWIRAIDTAVNVGPALSIAVQVNPPPDYVLRDIANIDFSAGTHDNTCAIGTALYGPNNSCEQTWASHFEDEGWTTIQQQITAGYPLYLQPVPLGVATFTKEVDFGVVLPPTIVTLSANIDIMAGDVDFTQQISYKAAAEDAWTDMEAGQTQVFVSTFRYIKVTLTFESETGRTGLARINELLVRLDVKLRTDAGHATVSANPTAVTFGVAFIDVQSITLTPLGTTPRYAVYDFDDSPYPTGFDIYLFDLDGNPTTGTVSWTARGV